ncbi:MAG: hypothetical protein NHB15_07560 [Methanosarcina barkeri]|nr:hypothetical protein [Methanosarcina sp. ERenArc_MAG2]
MLAKGSEPWLFTAALVTALFAILSRAMNSSNLNHVAYLANNAAYLAMALTFFMVLFSETPKERWKFRTLI